jgi:hypothetical protein
LAMMNCWPFACRLTSWRMTWFQLCSLISIWPKSESCNMVGGAESDTYRCKKCRFAHCCRYCRCQAVRDSRNAKRIAISPLRGSYTVFLYIR